MASARENNGTVSENETIELKLMSRYQVGLGVLFSKKEKKKGSLLVTSHKEETKQTESKNY